MAGIANDSTGESYRSIANVLVRYSLYSLKIIFHDHITLSFSKRQVFIFKQPMTATFSEKVEIVCWQNLLLVCYSTIDLIVSARQL